MESKMKFQEFCSEVHAFVEDDSITKAQTIDVVEAVVEAITEQVSEGEDVKIPSLGIFKYNVRKARKARNPKTGESVDVPKKAAVSFKPAKSFKDIMNGVKIK
jgi:nucleoid DNA-binding protein